MSAPPLPAPLRLEASGIQTMQGPMEGSVVVALVMPGSVNPGVDQGVAIKARMINEQVGLTVNIPGIVLEIEEQAVVE